MKTMTAAKSILRKKKLDKSSLPKPLVYLVGGFTVPETKAQDWLERSGCQFRCYSYAYVRPGAFFYDERVHQLMEYDIQQGLGIMMDSSAHSFHNFLKMGNTVRKEVRHQNVALLRDQVIKDYVAFVKSREKDFDFYVNFDYVRDSPVIYNVLKQLEKMGIKSMPVFHGDAGFSWLERYFDEGYDYICIGTVARSWEALKRYYGKIFELGAKYGKNVKFHGLACTGFNVIFGWPWYSVDSSSWAKIGGYGQLVLPSPITNRLQYVHVSERETHMPSSFNHMEKSVQRGLQKMIEGLGFDFELLRTSVYERGVFNAFIFANIHKWRPQEPLFAKWRSLV